MPTKPLRNVVIKDGKLVRKRTYRAKSKAMKTKRLVDAWVEKARAIYSVRAASWSEQSEKLKVVRKT